MPTLRDYISATDSRPRACIYYHKAMTKQLWIKDSLTTTDCAVAQTLVLREKHDLDVIDLTITNQLGHNLVEHWHVNEVGHGKIHQTIITSLFDQQVLQILPEQALWISPKLIGMPTKHSWRII